MMLSVQQRFILDALRKLGCIRRAQLLVLTREKFRRDDLVISEKRLDAMLRQLRYGMGDFRLEGDLVKLSQKPPDAQPAGGHRRDAGADPRDAAGLQCQAA